MGSSSSSFLPAVVHEAQADVDDGPVVLEHDDMEVDPEDDKKDDEEESEVDKSVKVRVREVEDVAE